MPEPIWYYARGDVEKGPLTSAQIKALATAGKIRPDDYVWKEGMENWLPAGEVKELFPADAAKPKEKDPDSSKPGEKGAEPGKAEKFRRKPEPAGPASRSLPTDPQQLIRLASRIALLVGIVTVVLARGCDSIGVRYIARLKAISTSAESRFQAEWEQRRQALETQKNALQEQSQRSPAEQADLQDLSKKIAELDQQKQAEESRLRRSRWRELETNATLAGDNNVMWGFWRELLFQFGALVLASGLVAVAYSSEGPERWICLVVLAVVVYSIFNGSPLGD
jgi:hypothetical protein